MKRELKGIRLERGLKAKVWARRESHEERIERCTHRLMRPVRTCAESHEERIESDTASSHVHAALRPESHEERIESWYSQAIMLGHIWI